MVCGDDVHVRHLQRFVAQVARIEPVHDKVIGIEALDVGRDLPCPGGGRLHLIARFPAENRLVLRVANTCQRVCTGDDEVNRPLEILNQLGIRPEVVLRFSPEPGVFRAPPLPAPVVDERNDQAHALFVGHLQGKVQCAERLLVEPAWAQHVSRHVRSVVGAPHRDDIGASHGAAHLAHRGKRVGQFEPVGQSPWIRPGERDVILGHQQIGDVP